MRGSRIRFQKRAGVLPALFLLALAGCGGGDDGGSVTTDADVLVPSKRDYIVQADTICGQSEQGVQTDAEVTLGLSADDFKVAPSGEIVFKAGRRPSDAEIRAFGTDVVIPRLREQIADLRALTPPTGDEQEVDRDLRRGRGGDREAGGRPVAVQRRGCRVAGS